MADRFQTQCPHCGVKFQITAQQLQLANGTVRCGSCLQVFLATQNLVPLADGPTTGVGSARPSARPSATPADAQRMVQRPAISVPPSAPAAPAPTAPRKPATPARPADDDDLVDQILRELEDSAQVASKPAAKPAPAAPAPKAPPATPPRPAAAAPAPTQGDAPAWSPPPPKPAAPPAGGWAPPPARPTKPAATPAQPARPKPATSAPRPPADSKFVSDDPFGVQSTNFDEKDFRPEEDESWAKDLIGEKPVDEREERVRKFQISADELKLDDTTGIQHTSGLAARLQQMETPATEMPTPIRRTAPAGGSQVDDEFDFLSDPGLTMQDIELPGIEDGDDSLMVAAQAHQVRWGNDVFWGTLSIVFLFVLLAQYLVVNRDTLARDPGWSGVYSVACGAFGCELPGDSDVRRIQGANLVVRSHPAASNALMIDAVIYNRAGFAQPFPRLELGFSDIRSNPVAGRVFEPSEYLKGELAKFPSMPPDTPIHLSLEIRDPGSAAVNYELRFLPPDAS